MRLTALVGTDERVRDLDEDGVVFDVGAVLEDGLRYEQRTPRCDVHLGNGPPEAAAVGVGLEGVTQVLPGRSLVHQHQGHLVRDRQL